jgi:glycerol kinase
LLAKSQTEIIVASLSSRLLENLAVLVQVKGESRMLKSLAIDSGASENTFCITAVLTYETN